MTTQLATSATLPEPPTAPGLPVLGNSYSFIKAKGVPVRFLCETANRYGDLVHLKLGKQSVYLLAHPDLIHEVLVKRYKEFHKPGLSSGRAIALARFLGAGVLTANHEEWRPQRKLIQPLMHTKHITSYADTMAKFGDQLLQRWRDGEQRDIAADMVQVTMWIIAETMFGMNVDQTPLLEEAAHIAQSVAIADLISPIPAWVTGRERQAKHANDIMNSLVKQFMDERRANGHADRYDLLSLLMETKDEDGNPVSDQFVRDNILTLFFAGHETTANTLTWAFYYLDKNPDVAARLQQEVDSVLGGRLPTLADLPNLPYTLMVIKETMRNEPTVASFARYILDDLELGGYRLKGHSRVFIPPYVLHHDPRWWSQPEKFDPTRFSEENEPNIPKYAYLPFGGGPRICIGNHFALMEAQILLAVIASRYELKLVPGTDVKYQRQVTTSPKNGLPMRLKRR